MQRRPWIRTLAAVVLGTMPVAVLAQFTTPHVITTPGAVTTALGDTVFTNHGMVGVGRISASQLDQFGESFGSVSGLQITNWAKNPDGSYRGTLNILPDRGFNSGAYFADYAARINQLDFNFTPYTGSANIGGTTIAEQIAAQNQMVFTSGITGEKFTYFDPGRGGLSFTTGLDPGVGYTTLFGFQIVPYVQSYTGAATPDAETPTTYQNINRLALDAEALILKTDGSGYVGDEYGACIYYFNSSKQIVGVLQPPQALVPHQPLGTPFFGGAPNPLDGRRPNQGIEGVALSPDGTRLFALLQSATMQDSDSAANQTRRNTRLLVYDVSVTPVPRKPFASYAVTLPTLRGNGNGSAVNNTAQQSEIVALDNARLLILPRDGNGLGTTTTNPSVYKTVILTDLNVGSPTNFGPDWFKNAQGGQIATVSGGASNLLPGITPVAWTEVVNMLNTTQLAKFNVALDTGGAVTKLTLGEKWEGLALMPALDPQAPDDYFLFIGNDNDFLVSNGRTIGPDPSLGIISYNGFAQHPPARIPPPVGSPNNENDTLFLVYRVTIASGDAPAATAEGTADSSLKTRGQPVRRLRNR